MNSDLIVTYFRLHEQALGPGWPSILYDHFVFWTQEHKQLIYDCQIASDSVTPCDPDVSEHAPPALYIDVWWSLLHLDRPLDDWCRNCQSYLGRQSESCHSITFNCYFWDMQMQICTTCIPKSQNGIEVRSLCRRIVAYIKWERRAVEVEKFKSNNESILAKECCELQWLQCANVCNKTSSKTFKDLSTLLPLLWFSRLGLIWAS